MTGQNEQVPRVAVHACGDTIHLEQARQALPVLFPLLKTLYDADLAFHKGLASVRQVYEHAIELAADSGLVGRQPQNFPAHLVEGARNLAYLVRGIHIDGFHVGRRAPAIVLLEVADRIGQPNP